VSTASSEAGASLARIVAVFLAPTSAVTAVLFYFGRVSDGAYYSYFGVDAGHTIGLSSTDYVQDSVNIVFTPLVNLALLLFALPVGIQLLDVWLGDPAHRNVLRRVIRGTDLVTGAALLTAAVLLNRLDLLNGAAIIKPITLAAPVLLAGYAAHLRRLRAATLSTPPPSPLAITAVRGAGVAVLGLALFWAVGILAQDRGRTLAHTTERELITRRAAIIYSTRKLDIGGPGVQSSPLDPAGGGYRYRYTGLRVLAATADGGYVLLPSGWTRTFGDSTIPIKPDSTLRIELLAIPVD
jgi:hypothetical protein